MAQHLPRLLAVTDRRFLPGEDLRPWIQALGKAGVDGVQIREKDLPDREVYELAVWARGELPGPVRLLINGRADLALASGADGVHLPSDGVPVPPLRRRFGPDFLVGRSTHHPDEVGRAREEGADYVTFGPVYPTPSKERYGSPQGLENLRRAVAMGLPVFALGGVTLERLDEVAAAGAAGVAAIRMFLHLEELPAVVRKVQEVWQRP